MEELYLQDNKLDIDGTRALAKCVHNVKNLVMRSCDLTDDKMEPILDEISKLSEPVRQSFISRFKNFNKQDQSKYLIKGLCRTKSFYQLEIFADGTIKLKCKQQTERR